MSNDIWLRAPAVPPDGSKDIRLYPEGADSGTQSYSYTATGGLTFAGAAPQSRQIVFASTGGLTFAGAATPACNRVATGAGGLQTGGSALVSFFAAGAPAQYVAGILGYTQMQRTGRMRTGI